MAEITDDYMRQRLTQARGYTLVLLRRTELYRSPEHDPLIWEHGRRNMGLQADGVMPIVCPVGHESGLAGIGIFDAGPEEVTAIMEGDPAVAAGVFSYEVYPCRGFPGSALPA